MTDTEAMPAKIYLTDDKGIIMQHTKMDVAVVPTPGGWRVTQKSLSWEKLCGPKDRFVVVTGCIVVIPGVHTTVLQFPKARTLMRGDALDIDGMAFEVTRQ
jgi:hypothetical protein